MKAALLFAAFLLINSIYLASGSCLDDLANDNAYEATVIAAFQQCFQVSLPAAQHAYDMAEWAARAIEQNYTEAAVSLNNCNNQYGLGATVPTSFSERYPHFNMHSYSQVNEQEKKYDGFEGEALCNRLRDQAQRRTRMYLMNRNRCLDNVNRMNSLVSQWGDIEALYTTALGQATASLSLCAAGSKRIMVTVKNEAKGEGTWFGPVWFGVANSGAGILPLWSIGSDANSGIAAAATGTGLPSDFTDLDSWFSPKGMGSFVLDGNAQLTQAKNMYPPDGFPLDSNADRKASFVLEIPAGGNSFGLVAKLLPSDDFFVGIPQSPLINAAGTLDSSLDSTIYLTTVYDAGVLVDTEVFAPLYGPQTDGQISNIPANPVSVSAGYLGSFGRGSGSPIILGGLSTVSHIQFDSINADFTRPGFRVASVKFEQLPWVLDLSADMLLPAVISGAA